MNEFSILELSRIILRKWWIIVVLTVGGGLVGVVFNYLQPPVYEAKARLVVNIDVLKYQLTSREENRIMDAVVAIANSPEVQESVVVTARSSFGYSLTIADFRQKATLERAWQVLEMRVRDGDPMLATTLVNLWAEAAYQRLTQAQEHAVAAGQIQRQIDGWLACLPGYITPTPEPLQQPLSFILAWNEKCKNYSPEDIEVAISRLSNELTLQRRNSLGLVPFLEFAYPEKASTPDKPVLYDRGTVILGGTVIGLLLSIWLVYFLAGKA